MYELKIGVSATIVWNGGGGRTSEEEKKMNTLLSYLFF